MANKLLSGLKNVHYSIVTETVGDDGSITSSYSEPKAWKGAVNISFSQNGSNDNFYADDSVYANLFSNIGYTGSFECALIPEDVYVNVFGMTKDSVDGVAEYSDAKPKYIALMFEFAGDALNRRFCFYRVSLNRPNVESSTKTESPEAKTQTCDLSATARPDDGLIKYYVEEGSSAYAGFYSSVTLPVPANEG